MFVHTYMRIWLWWSILCLMLFSATNDTWCSLLATLLVVLGVLSSLPFSEWAVWLERSVQKVWRSLRVGQLQWLSVLQWVNMHTLCLTVIRAFFGDYTASFIGEWLYKTLRLYEEWRWLYSHRNVWITVKLGLVLTKGSWLMYLATQDSTNPLSAPMLVWMLSLASMHRGVQEIWDTRSMKKPTRLDYIHVTSYP